MKKIIIFFIVLLGVFALTFFMYSQKREQSSQSPHIKNSNQERPLHLRFGHNTPVNSALHEASLRFADEVKKRTKGRVIVDVYPNQLLGNDYQMVEMARKGELDILLTPTAKMSVSVPSMQYADLPFYFPSRQDLYDMLDGEPGEMILNNMKSIGLIGVTFWENGFKHLTANFPILTPADLQGKKIRVMKSRIIMEQFKSFGATPLAIDFHKTKQALSDKIVDGEENPLIAIASMGFYEVQTDITLSEHAFLGYVLSFSEKTLSKLPNSLRLLLIETAKEVTPWERQETQKREKSLLELIKKAGVKVHTLTKEQREEFSKFVKYIPEQYEPIIGADVLSKTKELLYKKYGAFLNHKEHLLIGIDADVSVGEEVAGLEIKRGVELAVEEINAKGGVLGKPIEVILKNHKTTPSVGVENIKEFVQNPNLVAIVGGKHSAVIAEELKTIEKVKVPYLIPWAATSKVVKNRSEESYVFRISANDEVASKFIINYVMKHYKSPAIIVENSVWGRENLKAMKRYLQGVGKAFKAEVVVNRGAKDFDKYIKTIEESGAKSIVLVVNSIEGSKIIEAVSKRKNPTPIVSHWGILGGDFYQKNKKVLSKVDLTVFQTFSFSKSSNKTSKHLLSAYKKRYVSKAPKIDFAVAQAYDITKILVAAIEKAQSSEAKKVKDSLESLESYDGVIKRYKHPFTDTRHDALTIDDFYMAKFNGDGELTPVKR